MLCLSYTDWYFGITSIETQCTRPKQEIVLPNIISIIHTWLKTMINSTMFSLLIHSVR